MKVEEIRYAMESRRSVSADDVNCEILKAAGCSDRVCVLPNDLNDRAQYLGDALVQMLTRKPSDDRLRGCVGSLIQALSYMLNSASWRENELFDFDLMELKRKLQRFAK